MKFGAQVTNLTVLRQVNSVAFGNVLPVDSVTTACFAKLRIMLTKC